MATFNPVTNPVNTGQVGSQIANYYNTALTGNPVVQTAINNMAGQISRPTKRAIWDAAAQRGISSGVGIDSPLLDTVYLNTIGKTAEDLSALGSQQYLGAMNAVPALNPSDLFRSPEEQAQSQLEWQKLQEQIATQKELSAKELANAREIAAMNNQTARNAAAAESAAAAQRSQAMMGYLNQLLNRPTSAADFSNPWGARSAGLSIPPTILPGQGGTPATTTGDTGYSYTGAAPNWAQGTGWNLPTNYSAMLPGQNEPTGGYSWMPDYYQGSVSTNNPVSSLEFPISSLTDDFSFFY